MFLALRNLCLHDGDMPTAGHYDRYQSAASAPAFRPVVKAAGPQPAWTGRFCRPVCRRRTLTGAPPVGPANAGCRYRAA